MAAAGYVTDRYAVMGNPIAHSKSPRIHTLFAAQFGQAIDYRAILVEPGRFAQAVADFMAEGGKGLNITVPFKEEAWTLAATRSPRAQRAGAVNTLVLDPAGAHYGDNTDGVGLVRDLKGNQGCVLANQAVLLLGAGGAARGMLGPLLEEQPARLVIANRTPARAVELARAYRDLGLVEGSSLSDLAGRSFDVVINATAAGLSGQVPDLPAGVVQTHSWCYDLMYADEPTAFVRWARATGAARAIDGLGMLVEQAAEAFFLWRRLRPATGPVIEALRQRR
jgi:shikimate dehydrogenase